MPRTTKKPKAKSAFCLNLGNIEERGGHRRDCAQAYAQIVCRKDAVGEDYVGTNDDAEAFLTMLNEKVHLQTFEVELWEGCVIEFHLNTGRVVKKDVTEMKV